MDRGAVDSFIPKKRDLTTRAMIVRIFVLIQGHRSGDECYEGVGELSSRDIRRGALG